MMTTTGIVRFFGFMGTAAFLGIAATSTSTIRAQNDDQPPPPPPIVSTSEKPQAPPAGSLPTPGEDKPGLPSLPAIEEVKPVPVESPGDEKTAEIKPAPAPAPAVEEIKPVPVDAPKIEKLKEIKPAPAPAPVVEEIKPVPVDAPRIEKLTDGPASPRAPEPEGLEAPAAAVEPLPIAEAAPARARKGPSASASLSEDPDAQARSFVERNRREAEAQLKALNTEAAQLRNRLQRIESGIRRWQALVDAMDRSEQELPDRLEALPRARPTSAARRGDRKPPVVQSTPETPARNEYVAGPDGVFRPVAPAHEVDPVTRAQFVPAPTPR